MKPNKKQPKGEIAQQPNPNEATYRTRRGVCITIPVEVANDMADKAEIERLSDRVRHANDEFERLDRERRARRDERDEARTLANILTGVLVASIVMHVVRCFL